MTEESWPDHSSELARKAMECVERQMLRYQNGELSASALRLVADTLAEVTQGLIPNDIWKVIYEVRKEAEKAIRSSKK